MTTPVSEHKVSPEMERLVNQALGEYMEPPTRLLTAISSLESQLEAANRRAHALDSQLDGLVEEKTSALRSQLEEARRDTETVDGRWCVGCGAAVQWVVWFDEREVEHRRITNAEGKDIGLTHCCDVSRTAFELRYVVQKARRLIDALENGVDEVGNGVEGAKGRLAAALDLADSARGAPHD